MKKIVYLNSFLLDENGDLKEYKEIKTPLVLIEHIPDFKKNTFWLNIKTVWALVGKIPPLTLEKNDLVLFKEENKRWGMFRFLNELDDFVVLQDAKGERKTKVKREVLKQLKLFGKILRVQNRV